MKGKYNLIAKNCNFSIIVRDKNGIDIYACGMGEMPGKYQEVNSVTCKGCAIRSDAMLNANRKVRA